MIAALDETIALTDHCPFRYADIYAGYAINFLVKGNEWVNGIGIVAGAELLKGNRHVALWARCCQLDRAPAEGGYYPGSSWLAKEVCRRQGKTIESSLWEIGPGPLASLKTSFPGDQIFDRPANPHEAAIMSADFVFIDPPNKSHWANIHELVRHLEPKQSVLIWLPIGANTSYCPPAEDGKSIQCREDALKLGMGTSTVRWANGGHTIGCQLLYRVSPAAQRALRKAVEGVEKVFLARRRLPSGGLLGVRHCGPDQRL